MRSQIVRQPTRRMLDSRATKTTSAQQADEFSYPFFSNLG
jgi:hypothetical protein